MYIASTKKFKTSRGDISCARIDNVSFVETACSLKASKSQLLSIDMPGVSTHVEMVITPLDNNRNSLKLVGTNKEYYLISIINFGAYPVRLPSSAGYLAEKLGISEIVAEYIVEVLKEIKINLIWLK